MTNPQQPDNKAFGAHTLNAVTTGTHSGPFGEQPAERKAKNKAAIELLEKWMSESSPEEIAKENESYKALKKLLDEEPQQPAAGPWIRFDAKDESTWPTTDKNGIKPNSILAFGVSPKDFQEWKEKYGNRPKDYPYPGMNCPDFFVACFVPQYGFLENAWYFDDLSMRGLVTHYAEINEPWSEKK